MIKDGEPSYEELEYLSRELGEKWKKLGRRLKVSQAAIVNLDVANKRLAEQAFEMLLAWKQKEGRKATYTVLYNALSHKLVEYRHLAEQFCCERL